MAKAPDPGEDGGLLTTSSQSLNWQGHGLLTRLVPLLPS